MKILTCTQQKEADAYTIANNNILSINLMEKAASLIADEISKRWDRSHRIVVFAGAGNNGGDALAVARLLFSKSYPVEIYLFNIKGTISEDCMTNIQRLQQCGFTDYHEISNAFEPPKLTAEDVVVDGLFGSGLNKPLSGGFASVVKYINASNAQVVSIDLPSGLMGEDNSNNLRTNIIRADLTLSIQLPKLAFLFPENEDIVGEWKTLDIGISQEFIAQADTPYIITEASEMSQLIKPRKRFAFKNNFGHALLIAGSSGMAGASILAARACLRSGVGLLTIHTPVCNHDILQTAVPEAMVQNDVHELYFAEPVDLDNYQAIAIGPGIGQEEETALATFDQLADCYIPAVLDADAINILSSHRNYLNRLPRRSILTPHIGELERLIGRCNDSFDRLTKAKELAAYLQCYIVLKGAYSTVITPEGKFYFNPTGNPGMATGGSGDVLTGIILALLAQGYSQENAARLGTFVHGLAGDIACRRTGEISLTASDIIAALPEAWKELCETK
ncbi:NAD(P)H-hydrate dehydratase [Bacteroides gallinaceum]|uniref:Bifunctional NAD(P)H-hydrate repair enzyme n=1 Tax=Bacteroides gallinaceum TaxID=1462571 RepID=A0ABT7XAC6_9BACE|nr:MULTISPECIES: NAD(P)H-hydrate dehydratase [Bacteroides]HJD10744.1 NAD(P)H-hydrate dehydratase [Candidatus Phocaeicola caecigallinarum]MBM6659764.1 NAD(P)H-hydrate dehydratase [Bacteroides gallinaceum]MDN0050808.1 NAD(P)H-hydrate dehydratase [Bacteroides gallinaceum]OUN80663.1 bifunctional ADP-dependent NAD(P)H-hydrate dehydratase/NAD(P)H-hydrate epimerase [Bacteroides sp. An51A]OUO74165.1 bifunctional ADP-dependent NAD(P)H-hydrate dehydratase/NAD(P)H-hydrate epimerase [Bacteroides sp. An269